MVRDGSASFSGPFIKEAYSSRRCPPKVRGAQHEPRSELPPLTDAWSALVHLAHAAVLPYSQEKVIRAPELYLIERIKTSALASEEHSWSSESNTSTDEQGSVVQSASEKAECISEAAEELEVVEEPGDAQAEQEEGQDEEEDHVVLGEDDEWRAFMRVGLADLKPFLESQAY